MGNVDHQRPVQPADGKAPRWRTPPVVSGLGLVLLLLCALIASRAADEPSAAGAEAEPRADFTNFETEPVRPLLLSPDRRRLYALNTADDRVQIFAVEDSGLRSLGEVAVGLRPVAMALRGSDELWVVNHLSDSVSVVDVRDPARAQVLRTHAVGDEPRDIVGAGPDGRFILVATARRPWPAAVGTDVDGSPSAGTLALGAVWAFDATMPQQAPVEISLPGMKLRSLAVAPDGRRVYAAVMHSGNRTSILDEAKVGTLPTPDLPELSGEDPPTTSLIIQNRPESGGAWVDEAGRVWPDPGIRLADRDVFAIGTGEWPPRLVPVTFQGLGTTLLSLAVQPGSGDLWVGNQEARNLTRFEPKLKGRAVEHRVSRVDAIGHLLGISSLNPQLTLGADPVSPELGLAQPVSLVFNGAGDRAYVAAFGSRQVALLDAAGQLVERLPTGFGPAGLALDEAGRRLYVLNHLEASVSVLSLGPTGGLDRIVATVPLAFDPTPQEVRAGRPMLYDAALGSAGGDQSCAVCHVFGDADGLAWDLGDPGGEVAPMPFDLSHENFVFKPRDFRFHPMKGPMVTQSLRGLPGSGAMHWRADRHGSEDDGTLDDYQASFRQFRPAFESLLGRATPLEADRMEVFGRFVATLRYPPNPMQNLDRGRTAMQEAGERLFNGANLIDSGITNCAGCHALPLGTNGRINFEGARSGQDFKAPQLRNLYEKLGRSAGPDALAGFGLTHDGSVNTVPDFLRLTVFRFPGIGIDPGDDRELLALEAYLLAFDTGMAPMVGQQVTVQAAPSTADRDRLDGMQERARLGDCDLLVRGLMDGRERSWLLMDGAFQPDVAAATPLARSELLGLTREPASGPLTFTCVPPGDGRRGALDRDRDGAFNGDELTAGSDPSDPLSRPGVLRPTATSTSTAAPSPNATPLGARLILPLVHGAGEDRSWLR